MIIAVDAMGGDYAPANPVEGAVRAAREDGIRILLVGDEQKIGVELAKHDTSGLPIEIEHASEVILMEEPTLTALRAKRRSGFVRALSRKERRRVSSPPAIQVRRW